SRNTLGSIFSHPQPRPIHESATTVPGFLSGPPLHGLHLRLLGLAPAVVLDAPPYQVRLPVEAVVQGPADAHTHCRHGHRAGEADAREGSARTPENARSEWEHVEGLANAPSLRWARFTLDCRALVKACGN